MLVGYNTNIPYKGKVYHAQTEDTGIENSVIISLLYFKGAILATKKSSYAHLKGSPNFEEKVREQMKEQHKSIIKELVHGKISGEKVVPESIVDTQAVEEMEKKGSLDDILIDYILKQSGKK